MCHDSAMAKPTKRPAPVPPTREAARRRSALERASAPILMRLHNSPRWAFPLFTGLLLFAGLVVPSPAASALFLGLLLLLLGWLVALSWSLLSWVARLMRLAVLGGLAMIVVSRLQGGM